MPRHARLGQIRPDTGHLGGNWSVVNGDPGDRLSFRPLTEDDLPLLGDWLGRPHLQETWREQDVSPESLREKYLPRVQGDDAARPFLVLRDGEPIGYIQWYHAGAVPGWWPDEPGPGVLGIDQFLANEEDLGRGIGTALVRRFTTRLFADPAVTEIRVDPSPDNPRALRCYEKVGFRSRGPIITPDGPAVWMVLPRPPDPPRRQGGTP